MTAPKRRSDEVQAQRSATMRAKWPPDYFRAKARAAWGDPPPDWIVVLAAEADRVGLNAVGLGYSVSALSCVIANKYALGRLDKVEQKVRGKLMGGTVECPVLGPLGMHNCLDYQRAPHTAPASLEMRLKRACKTCPHRRGNRHAE